LVRVRGCGICGSDLHYFSGGFPPPAVCPGHEIAGEVVAAGQDAAVAIGTRVAVEPLVVCGTCAYCRTGDYQLCPAFRVIGNGVDGGFADQVCVPAYAVFALPDEVDFEVGALAEPLAVAVHALRLARLTLGDRVLVLGGGTIGLLAVAAAIAAGAGEVWATVRHSHQEDAAIALGATRVFRGDDAAKELSVAARQQPIDTVIETVGGTAGTIDQAIRLVRRGGTVMVLGIFTAAATIDATSLVVKEVRLIGSMTYGRAGTRADFDRALALLRTAPERYRALITHRFPLEQIGAAFATAMDKSSGSIKVQIQG